MASILSKKQKHTLKDLKTLGQQLLSSRAHVNNLPLLLTFVSPTSPPQYLLETLLSLQSFFIPQLPELPSSISSSSSKKNKIEDSKKDNPEFIYKIWLRSKFDELVKLLIHVLISPESEDALRVRCFIFFFWFIVLWSLELFCNCCFCQTYENFSHMFGSFNYLDFGIIYVGGCVGYIYGVREVRECWKVSFRNIL